VSDDLRPINPLALFGAYALAAITPTRKRPAPAPAPGAIRGRRRAGGRRRRGEAPAPYIRPTTDVVVPKPASPPNDPGHISREDT
jgi:hypothetical protein